MAKKKSEGIELARFDSPSDKEHFKGRYKLLVRYLKKNDSDNLCDLRFLDTELGSEESDGVMRKGWGGITFSQQLIPEISISLTDALITLIRRGEVDVGLDFWNELEGIVREGKEVVKEDSGSG